MQNDYRLSLRLASANERNYRKALARGLHPLAREFQAKAVSFRKLAAFELRHIARGTNANLDTFFARR